MGQQLWGEERGCIPVEFANLKVRDLWREEGGWDMNRIKPYLSDRRVLELGAMVVDTVTGARDRMSWNESADGEFSVKSAYALITRDYSPRQNVELFFKRIWQIKVPERVKTFLWLIGHQVVMSNSERFRRHLCDTDMCQICKGGSETILHIIRDCPATSGLWNHLVPTQERCDFFRKSLLEWLYDNLAADRSYDTGSWSTIFAMTVWWSWKWRCGNIFGENGRCRDRVKFLKDMSNEVTRANAGGEQRNAGRSVERLVKWVLPSEGWFKLNTDGASRGNPGQASAGGVLRDCHGNWGGGFALHIGRCSAPMAELWGVYYGLYMAWERRVSRLELEIDSEMVVAFLQTGIGEAHPLSFLVRLCHGFLSKDWSVRVSHVYREANRLADGLANYAFSLPLGFHGFDVVPDDVVSIVSDDIRGPARPRRVPD